MRSALCVLCLVTLFCSALFGQDRLTTTGGDVLNGKFVKLEAGKVFFEVEKVASSKSRWPMSRISRWVLHAMCAGA